MWLMPKLYQGLICFENTLSDQARMMYHCNILLMYFPLSPPNSSSASFCPGLIHSLACLMCWSPSHWDQYLQYNQHAWGNIKHIWLYCLDVILEGLLKRSIKTIYVQSLTCVPIYLWNVLSFTVLIENMILRAIRFVTLQHVWKPISSCGMNWPSCGL